MNFIPLLKWTLYKNRYSKLDDTAKQILQCIENRFSKIEIEKDKLLNLELILSERDKLVKNDHSLKDYLDNSTMVGLVHDFFAGSIETSSALFSWILLLMKSYSNFEFRLREEVNLVVGDRIPTLNDMSQCNFVMAFISESLRFKPGLPLSPIHKLLEDYKHGNHYIYLMNNLYTTIRYSPETQFIVEIRLLLSNLYKCKFDNCKI